MKIIPLVVGTLGAIPKQFGNRLKQIGIIVGTAQVQKTILLGMATVFSSIVLLWVSWIIIILSFRVGTSKNKNIDNGVKETSAIMSTQVT